VLPAAAGAPKEKPPAGLAAGVAKESGAAVDAGAAPKRPVLGAVEAGLGVPNNPPPVLFVDVALPNSDGAEAPALVAGAVDAAGAAPNEKDGADVDAAGAEAAPKPPNEGVVVAAG
jgi:hypothetical protein